MLLLILHSEVNSEMFKGVQNLGKWNRYVSGVSAVPALCVIQRNIIIKILHIEGQCVTLLNKRFLCILTMGFYRIGVMYSVQLEDLHNLFFCKTLFCSFNCQN